MSRSLNSNIKINAVILMNSSCILNPSVYTELKSQWKWELQRQLDFGFISIHLLDVDNLQA